MPGVHLKWTGGAQFLAADEAGHVVVADRDGAGMKPPDLLLASLASCAGIDVAEILAKKRKKVTAIEVQVTKENEPDPPWTIKRIDLVWTIRGHNISEKAASDVIRLSVGKYCSVASSLVSELVSTVHVIDEEG
jgi:putative redox protein